MANLIRRVILLQSQNASQVFKVFVKYEFPFRKM